MWAFRAAVPYAAVFMLADATYPDQLPNLSRVTECKLIREETERLRCYDRTISEAPAHAPASVTDTYGATRFSEGSWFVSESKLPDDSAQLVAALEAIGGKAALVLRCQQGRTDAYVTVQSFVGAAAPLPVQYKFNDGEEIAARWLPAKDGNALFVPTQSSAMEFIRLLPEQGTLGLTVHDFVGRSDFLRFGLGPIADLRRRMAGVCLWPAPQPDVASWNVGAGAPNAAGKIVDIPIVRHRWNTSIRHPHAQH
jgi:hypothetical protein